MRGTARGQPCSHQICVYGCSGANCCGGQPTHLSRWHLHRAPVHRIAGGMKQVHLKNSNCGTYVGVLCCKDMSLQLYALLLRVRGRVSERKTQPDSASCFFKLVTSSVCYHLPRCITNHAT